MDRIRLCAEPTMEKDAARLSYERRVEMPKSQFALPKEKKKDEPGKGAYPIPDARHARNALARVSQHGTPAERARVRARVHAKFPGIEVEGKKEASAVDDEAIDKLASALALGTALAEEDLFGLRKQALETAARLMAKGAQGRPEDAAFLAGQKAGREAVQAGTQKQAVEQPAPSPQLRTGREMLGPIPPKPVDEKKEAPTTGLQPLASLGSKEAKFAAIMESTRQRMLSALMKTGTVLPKAKTNA